ncbi:MAG: acyl-CoA thioesterase [Leptospiraceae bacterium]|nr:acyl-CoA thioesterase [Leptospiraceae bacterium]MCP5502979.1 acyl-CoA thioesterase [Leptospiraceae bacterium]
MFQLDDRFELVTRHIVMQKDLNQHGHIFGGTMLAWIDEAAAVYVMQKISYSNIVTVSMDDVNFKSPGRNGDIIEIYAYIESTGKSSITVRTIATNLDSYFRKHLVIDCKITYVCLDLNGRPYPFFLEKSV